MAVLSMPKRMPKWLVSAVLVAVGSGSLFAGDWLPWQKLDGGRAHEQAGTVEIRFRREESGDDPLKGFLLQYELRNANPTLVAQASVAFAWQDPQTGKWADASIERATIVELKPKASSAAQKVYSPDKNGVDYGAVVTWSGKKGGSPSDIKTLAQAGTPSRK